MDVHPNLRTSTPLDIGAGTTSMLGLTLFVRSRRAVTIGGMPTILIVDDHAAFRHEARHLLEAEGFTVIGEAGDGAAALLLATAERPDVLLLDIGLPDIDGFAVADRLASIHPPIRVILTSSRDEAIYGARVRDATSLGFVRKDELSGGAIRDLMAAP